MIICISMYVCNSIEIVRCKLCSRIRFVLSIKSDQLSTPWLVVQVSFVCRKILHSGVDNWHLNFIPTRNCQSTCCVERKLCICDSYIELKYWVLVYIININTIINFSINFNCWTLYITSIKLGAYPVLHESRKCTKPSEHYSCLVWVPPIAFPSDMSWIRAN